jgi:hypothetical protein
MPRPPLTIDLILSWADAWHARTGRWPAVASGVIPESRGMTWKAVDAVLRRASHGLPAGSSLARLLVEHRGMRSRINRPRLTEAIVLTWADRHRQRTGDWPCMASGPVADAAGETWHALDMALRAGYRGLPGGSSVSRLLKARRGASKARAPRLTGAQILRWARLHRERTGRWPSVVSGPVLDAPGEDWGALNRALAVGNRGLPGGSSLAGLLRPLKG